MQYGTIPVVRRTGGLADTVQEYDPDTGIGTGFCFEEESPAALMLAVRKALEVYSHEDSWGTLVLNAMKSDFSWTHSAEEYLNLYREAMRIHRG
jgi:starch synthase